jgi:hypothetical protein
MVALLLKIDFCRTVPVVKESGANLPATCTGTYSVHLKVPYRKRLRVRASPPTILPEEVSVSVRPMPELSGDTCDGENEPGPGAFPLSVVH